MHDRDEIVPFANFDNELQKLERRLVDAGLDVCAGTAFAAESRRAFATFYYSMFATDVPETIPSDTLLNGAALAGLGDLAVKLNRALDQGHAAHLLPHLASMLKGQVRMNAWSSVQDEAANKTSELYLGALAIGAGLKVELEDPVLNAKGRNPDVLLDFRDMPWAIAVKTPHSSKPRSIWANIEGAVEQIERSGRVGIPFINLKNIIDRAGLEARAPYSSVTEATAAVRQASGEIIDAVRANTVDAEWVDLFDGKLARPVVAYMTQVTVSARTPTGATMFMPVKELRLRPHPPCQAVDLDSLSGLDGEARDLVHGLNEVLQDNAGGN